MTRWLEQMVDQMEVEEGQMAVGITFLDVIGRYVEKEDVEMRLFPVAVIGETEKR